jgi:hypothetical protein
MVLVDTRTDRIYLYFCILRLRSRLVGYLHRRKQMQKRQSGFTQSSLMLVILRPLSAFPLFTLVDYEGAISCRLEASDELPYPKDYWLGRRLQGSWT